MAKHPPNTHILGKSPETSAKKQENYVDFSIQLNSSLDCLSSTSCHTRLTLSYIRSRDPRVTSGRVKGVREDAWDLRPGHHCPSPGCRGGCSPSSRHLRHVNDTWAHAEGGTRNNGTTSGRERMSTRQKTSKQVSSIAGTGQADSPYTGQWRSPGSPEGNTSRQGQRKNPRRGQSYDFSLRQLLNSSPRQKNSSRAEQSCSFSPGQCINTIVRDGNNFSQRGRNEMSPRGRNNHSPTGRKNASPRGKMNSSPSGRNIASPIGRNSSSPRARNHSSPRGRNNSSPRRRNNYSPRGRNTSTPGQINNSRTSHRNNSSPRQSNLNNVRPGQGIICKTGQGYNSRPCQGSISNPCRRNNYKPVWKRKSKNNTLSGVNIALIPMICGLQSDGGATRMATRNQQIAARVQGYTARRSPCAPVVTTNLYISTCP